MDIVQGLLGSTVPCPWAPKALLCLCSQSCAVKINVHMFNTETKLTILCEFSGDIASTVAILRVQWRCCEFSGDVASSVLSFWHLTMTKIYSSS